MKISILLASILLSFSLTAQNKNIKEKELINIFREVKSKMASTELLMNGSYEHFSNFSSDSSNLLSNSCFDEINMQILQNYKEKKVKINIDNIHTFDMTSTLLPDKIYMLRIYLYKKLIEMTNPIYHNFLDENKIKEYKYTINDNKLKNNTLIIYFSQNNKTKQKLLKGEIHINIQNNHLLEKIIIDEVQIKNTNTDEIINIQINKKTIINYTHEREITVPKSILFEKKSIEKIKEDGSIFFEIENYETREKINFSNYQIQTMPVNLNFIDTNSSFRKIMEIADKNNDTTKIVHINKILNKIPQWYKIWNIDSINSNENDIIQILKNSWKACKKNTTLSYQISYLNEFESKNIKEADVYFSKKPFGTFGSHFITKNKENIFLFKNGLLTNISHTHKNIIDKIYVWKADADDVGNINNIYRNKMLFMPLVRSDIFFPEFIKIAYQSKNTKISNKIINDVNCFVIETVYQKDLSRTKIYLFINKDNYLPIELLLETSFSDNFDINFQENNTTKRFQKIQNIANIDNFEELWQITLQQYQNYQYKVWQEPDRTEEDNLIKFYLEKNKK
ncbi:MAG: hypothetical protein EAZ44_01460 [Cytophagia bacterium]|nr:MAG: hypothetical protein EAY69_07170 [Cytophagales bacterium]TAG06828.1 MAG: hypothetical protein EAZ44_01460 [Cytophagia bacterium]TAG43499.1 MAG: hypothetical protein EAZ31_04100 [Cytophagia bacterium]